MLLSKQTQWVWTRQHGRYLFPIEILRVEDVILLPAVVVAPIYFTGKNKILSNKLILFCSQSCVRGFLDNYALDTCHGFLRQVQ